MVDRGIVRTYIRSNSVPETLGIESIPDLSYYAPDSRRTRKVRAHRRNNVLECGAYDRQNEMNHQPIHVEPDPHHLIGKAVLRHRRKPMPPFAQPFQPLHYASIPAPGKAPPTAAFADRAEPLLGALIPLCSDRENPLNHPTASFFGLIILEHLIVFLVAVLIHHSPWLALFYHHP